MKNPLKDCEGCKQRREAMMRTLQGMASMFMHPNATPAPQPQPSDSVKPPITTESESGK